MSHDPAVSSDGASCVVTPSNCFWYGAGDYLLCQKVHYVITSSLWLRSQWRINDVPDTAVTILNHVDPYSFIYGYFHTSCFIYTDESPYIAPFFRLLFLRIFARHDIYIQYPFPLGRDLYSILYMPPNLASVGDGSVARRILWSFAELIWSGMVQHILPLFTQLIRFPFDPLLFIIVHDHLLLFMMIHFLFDSLLLFAVDSFPLVFFMFIYTTFKLLFAFLSKRSNQLPLAIQSLHSFRQACLYWDYSVSSATSGITLVYTQLFGFLASHTASWISSSTSWISLLCHNVLEDDGPLEAVLGHGHRILHPLVDFFCGRV